MFHFIACKYQWVCVCANTWHTKIEKDEKEIEKKVVRTLQMKRRTRILLKWRRQLFSSLFMISLYKYEHNLFPEMIECRNRGIYMYQCRINRSHGPWDKYMLGDITHPLKGFASTGNYQRLRISTETIFKRPSSPSVFGHVAQSAALICNTYYIYDKSENATISSLCLKLICRYEFFNLWEGSIVS